MDKFIGIVFTVIYLVESALFFFLNNRSDQDIRFVVMAVVAIAIIWIADYLILRSSISYKSTLLIVIGVVIVILMPVVWGMISK
jgi:hypothetical protein